jgi:hypothetical protein
MKSMKSYSWTVFVYGVGVGVGFMFALSDNPGTAVMGLLFMVTFIGLTIWIIKKESQESGE